MQKMKIGFIGFSGSGKSSIVKEAEKNGYPALDIDEMISKRCNIDINGLILSGKELEFRQIEHDFIKIALSGNARFIAFGGGVHSGHPAYGELSGFEIKLVFLKAEFESLLKRFAGRPMLDLLGLQGYRNLFNKREPLYEQASDYIINVEGKTKTEIFREIDGIWNLLNR
jgi:shikimate kinase